MKYEIKEVKTKEEADKVIEFILKKGTFPTRFTKGELEFIPNTVIESIGSTKSRFWYAVNSDEEIIGVIGSTEDDYKNDGYYLNFFAVREDFKKQGIGTRLLQTAEEFVRQNGGRHITIDTGAEENFQPARKFYEKNGYTKTGEVPDFYYDGEARVDYYKRIKL